MNIIARFNMGKRLNLIQRNGFQSYKKPKPSDTTEYGYNIAEVDISDECLQEEVNKLIDRLKVTNKQQQQQISEKTIGQFSNSRYLEKRRFRLTASHFGEVAKRRAHTPYDCLVTKILTDKQGITTPAIEYYIQNEVVAINKFQEETGKTVIPSGLFVDVQYGFLAGGDIAHGVMAALTSCVELVELARNKYHITDACCSNL
ncbi:unnamed protein product [Psylliodes chrysocephalus]|uniref:Uncharacterized protein n=1 Tax=Psylliodes chrysocephalus TaxID=3402493 RepID=A0A9P0GGS2_9CUCU|nr:unnamed protein product [Psylliodes chrysocephala]